MQRTILLGGLLLCAAVTSWGQDNSSPSQPQSSEPQQPQRIEERHYVRRFSAGITFGLSPLNHVSKREEVQKIESSPPVELRTEVDPKNDRISLGFTVQLALTDRLALAVAPALKKTTFHTFTRKLEGVDNSATSFDERALTLINEDTTARLVDIPILLRRYSTEHTEPGARWFYQGGVTYRMIGNVRTDRTIDPEPGAPVKDSIPLEHKKRALGAVFGIGGQFIDDFGIRAIPEVRYTYWKDQPFNSLNGRSRRHQVEILLTFAF